MASFTLNVRGAFADGTSIGAYPASRWPNQSFPSGTPLGSATNSQTVSGQAVTFTGLTDNTRYYVTNASGSRYISIHVGQDVAVRHGVASGDVSQIVVLTQAAYDALTPDDSTLYVVVG